MPPLPPECPTTPKPLSGKDINSFAYKTIKDRLPIILTKAIDEACRLMNGEMEEKEAGNGGELKRIIIPQLTSLKYELQHDKSLREMDHLHDHVHCAKTWNAALVGNNNGSWFSTPWLFIECYMYRRIQEACDATTTYKTLDLFQRQKQESFFASEAAIRRLAIRLDSLLPAPDIKDCGFILAEFLNYSLWGNQSDLSLNITQQELSSVVLAQSANIIDTKNKDHIIVNDSHEIVKLLLSSRGTSGGNHKRVDLVLDNAGFELVVDFCLADILIRTGCVSEVVFHIKQFPWFVSDTTIHDFNWTLDKLEAMGMGNHWRPYLSTGQWRVTSDPFWTLPNAFWDLGSETFLGSDVAKVWREEIAPKSSLVVFKGDLNYRKLVSDLDWPTETSFETSLGPLAKPHGRATSRTPPILALRTCKSDSQTGLTPGRAAQLDKLDPEWRCNGKWGVIQFFAGNFVG